MKLDYPIRLQAYLAKSGCGSRRSCETLITSGRVKVNTKVVKELGTKVNREDSVTLDDESVEPNEHSYFFALNKPKGYVCTNYDPYERLYARDLIDIAERSSLFHVGRLDKDSTGLILFTNDGDVANKIMHPSSQIEKEYLLQANREIQKRDLDNMVRGVFIDEGKTPYRIKSYKLINRRVVDIILTEGKNRELRKLFDYYGYDVMQLQRIRIGTIQLGDLKMGNYRRLDQVEIDDLLLQVGASDDRRD